MLNNKTTHKVMFTFNFMGTDDRVKEAILLIPALDESKALRTVLAGLIEFVGPEAVQELLKTANTHPRVTTRIPEKRITPDVDGYDPQWSRYYC